MAGETQITVRGNLTGDPELRTTPSGQFVANFTIASTPRVFDRQANEWRDGETLFLRSAVWREVAENAAESLAKGMAVIAVGKLKSRKYSPKDGGEDRTVIEFEIESIGPDLAKATAKVTKRVKGDGGNSQPQQSSDGWGSNWGGGESEPPF